MSSKNSRRGSGRDLLTKFALSVRKKQKTQYRALVYAQYDRDRKTGVEWWAKYRAGVLQSTDLESAIAELKAKLEADPNIDKIHVHDVTDGSRTIQASVWGIGVTNLLRSEGHSRW